MVRCPAGAVFADPGYPVLNEHGEVAFQATVEIGPGRVDGRRGVPGARFASFERPSLNAAGEVVFVGHLFEGVGGVTNQNDGDVWGTLGGVVPIRMTESFIPRGS